MGNRNSSARLSPRLQEIVESIFREIDIDGSRTIDWDETLKWWDSNFAVINTRAMFEAVDADKNGKIELEEWVEFWRMVKQRGHSEEEIEEELNNIKEKGSWVQFLDCPSTHARIKD